MIAINPREADRLETNKTDLCFPFTQRPVRLSSFEFRSPEAHRLRRSTKADAVRRQVSAPLRRLLVSWRSSRHAGRVSFRIVVSLCPAQTGPGCSARCPPAVCATSCLQPRILQFLGCRIQSLFQLGIDLRQKGFRVRRECRLRGRAHDAS